MPFGIVLYVSNPLVFLFRRNAASFGTVKPFLVVQKGGNAPTGGGKEADAEKDFDELRLCRLVEGRKPRALQVGLLEPGQRLTQMRHALVGAYSDQLLDAQSILYGAGKGFGLLLHGKTAIRAG